MSNSIAIYTLCRHYYNEVYYDFISSKFFFLLAAIIYMLIIFIISYENSILLFKHCQSFLIILVYWVFYSIFISSYFSFYIFHCSIFWYSVCQLFYLNLINNTHLKRCLLIILLSISILKFISLYILSSSFLYAISIYKYSNIMIIYMYISLYFIHCLFIDWVLLVIFFFFLSTIWV